MTRSLFLLLVLAPITAIAQTRPDTTAKYSDPDSPEVRAAARAALKSAKILDLVAEQRDVVGATLGLVGTQRDVKALLKELDAKVTAQGIRISLAADVLFDFDKSELRPDAVPTLKKVALVLAGYPTSPVTIEGHTDGKGTDAYNQPLSERRAASVKAWCVAQGGIPASRLTTRGWGKNRPVAPNSRPDGSDDPEGRQKNRRVEITVENPKQ